MSNCTHRTARVWPRWIWIALIVMAGCTKPKPIPTVKPNTLTSNITPPVPSQQLQLPRKSSPRQTSEPRESIEATPSESIPRTDVIATTEDLIVPQVLLSEAHQKTCLAATGDIIPDVTVTSIEGTNHQLARLLGEQLTVLLFWNEQSVTSLEQFRRLPIDVLSMFADKGVKVIAVCVGGEVARVRELTGDAANKIVSLVDKDESLFHQFATSLVPRTYLLDKDGRILWFDIEYSQSTQRTLSNAVSYYLVNDS